MAKKGRKIVPSSIGRFAIFLRIFRDKTDFPLTTRNRIKLSASGGRTIALDRVLSTEVQLIIVKLDRRYFTRRQEHGWRRGKRRGRGMEGRERTFPRIINLYGNGPPKSGTYSKYV